MPRAPARMFLCGGAGQRRHLRFCLAGICFEAEADACAPTPASGTLVGAMARQTGPVRARLEYAAVGALLAPLAAMKRERAVRAGARLGALAMRLDRVDRPVAMRNLEIAFPG